MPKYNILIEGPIGSGKTHSLRTIVEETDKELFVLATEPGIYNILGDLPKDRCHIKYVSPAGTSWEVLMDNAVLINQTDPSTLQKMSPINRMDYQQFFDVITCMANFVDERSGEEFGPVDFFDPDKRVFAHDGLSGLSQMSKDLVVAAKPIITQPEWGVMMGNLERFIKKCCADIKCTYILISHIEKIQDQITGGTVISLSTLGQKLAPELVKTFDEIIFAKRTGDKFVWSTTESGVDLKTRVLGWRDDLPPTFAPLLKNVEPSTNDSDLPPSAGCSIVEY